MTPFAPTAIDRSNGPLRLPALGFGAAPVGNLYRALSDDDAGAIIDAVRAARIGYVDTAPHYGQGLSERRLGQFWPDADVVISTKVGRLLTPIDPPAPGTERHGFVDGDPFEIAYDYSYDGVMRSFESSLKRLKRDHINILYGHDLGQLTHGDDHPRHFKAFLEGGHKALSELKRDGRIKAFGLGVNEWQIAEEVLSHVDLDVIMLAGRYTLLEQGALDSFLPMCQSRGVAVVAAAPFNSGILAAGIQPGKVLHYNYAPAPPEIVARVQGLQDICAAHYVPLAAAALQFPLAHPAVASVVTGMSRPSQVTSTLSLFHTPIPYALWDDLKAAGLMHPSAPLPKVDAHG